MRRVNQHRAKHHCEALQLTHMQQQTCFNCIPISFNLVCTSELEVGFLWCFDAVSCPSPPYALSPFDTKFVTSQCCTVVSIDTHTAHARFLSQSWSHTRVWVGIPWVFVKFVLVLVETRPLLTSLAVVSSRKVGSSISGSCYRNSNKFTDASIDSYPGQVSLLVSYTLFWCFSVC